MDKTAAIILAAGKGTRMNCTTTNKVMSPLNKIPMLSYAIDNLKKADISNITVVVGYAKESIQNYFKDTVRYAIQEKQNGTARAFECGLKTIPPEYTTIISVYGDDSYIYSPSLYLRMINLHNGKQADVTLLTVVVNDPTGLGRIIRDASGKVTAIVEEKDATPKQKLINEINTGFYVFKRSFVESHLKAIQNNNKAHEYYLTDILGIAVSEHATVATLKETNLPWRGVNLLEELRQAQETMEHMKNDKA